MGTHAIFFGDAVVVTVGGKLFAQVGLGKEILDRWLGMMYEEAEGARRRPATADWPQVLSCGKVPEVGVEPTRAEAHWILNAPVRLNEFRV